MIKSTSNITVMGLSHGNSFLVEKARARPHIKSDPLSTPCQCRKSLIWMRLFTILQAMNSAIERKLEVLYFHSSLVGGNFI